MAIFIKEDDSTTILRLNKMLALVVGATSGIGHGIAVTLASQGHSIILAGRSSEAATRIIEECKSKGEGTFTFMKVDCFSLNAVRTLCSSIPKLDWLIMSQGMATIQGYTETEEGFDQVRR